MLDFTNPSAPRKDPPVLRAKGAETRHLVRPLVEVCRMYRGTDLAKRRYYVMQNLQRFYDVIDGEKHRFALTEQSCAELIATVDRMHAHQQALQDASIQRGGLLWGWIPKNHSAWHLARNASRGNPRMLWNYSDEDWVGKVARITRSCSLNNPAHRVSVSLMEKLRMAMHLQLGRI